METNRAAPEWGCSPFWSDSILFNERHCSVDSSLTLTLGANGLLDPIMSLDHTHQWRIIRGCARDACPPLAQNFFIFMQFLGKFGQIIGCRPLGWRHLLWEILDPPLHIYPQSANIAGCPPKPSSLEHLT